MNLELRVMAVGLAIIAAFVLYAVIGFLWTNRRRR